MTAARPRGFTLIEVVVTLFVLTLAATLVGPSVVSGVEALKARTEAAGLATFLRGAREQAVTHKRAYEVRVKSTEGIVEMRTGDTVPAIRKLGTGVRSIHQACQKILKEHLDMEPVLKAEEKSTVEVPVGFDPSAIRLTGNVTGSPPFKGTLEHHGWRVTKIKVNKPAEGQDAFVVHPAEVELT